MLGFSSSPLDHTKGIEQYIGQPHTSLPYIGGTAKTAFGDRTLSTFNITQIRLSPAGVWNMTYNGVERNGVFAFPVGNVVFNLYTPISAYVDFVIVRNYTGYNVAEPYISGVSDTTPPASITNLANSTPDCQSIIWTWTNPVDADYDGLMYWFNNTLQSPNLTAAHTFVTFSGLLENIDYTLSTKTFDTTGNLDDTFVNSTVRIICDLPPTASFISNTTCGNVPFAVQFNDTSYSNITSWNWTFSEGNYSDLQDPVYQYNETGMFGINLSATNIYGNNWSNVTDYIRAVPAWYTCPPTPTPTPTWQPIINPSTDVKTNWLGLLREWWWLPALIFVMIILFRRK